MRAELRRFSELLKDAQQMVIFTGAGISTESGISDFRSPDGLWYRMAPITYQDFMTSEEASRESWRRKLQVDKEMLGAIPNRGHRVIAALAESGRVRAVITQNVDGLHQASGITQAQLIELHGNATYATCLDCSIRYELEPIMSAFAIDETLPVCDRCQGIVKTATISFGQPMPHAQLSRAERAVKDCDLIIAIGSSLVVYPAAALPAIAKAAGSKMIILNRDPTELDELADLVVRAEIGETLGLVTGVE